MNTQPCQPTPCMEIDQLLTFTRNNLAEEMPVINSFKSFFNTTMPTTKINANSVQANKELHRNLLVQLQSQIVGVNNNRLFYDLIASNSISPYSVNCSSDLLLLNYFSQVLPSVNQIEGAGSPTTAGSPVTNTENCSVSNQSQVRPLKGD